MSDYTIDVEILSASTTCENSAVRVQWIGYEAVFVPQRCDNDLS